MSKTHPVLNAWQRLSKLPLGKRAFSRAVCLRAPYFGSISPLITELKPGLCSVEIKKRRAVTNHIGTVHAIAICNMAEIAAGVMTEISVPSTHRWIPKGMTVEYLQKAETDLRAVAEFDPLPAFGEAQDFVVPVLVYDRNEQLVFRAAINMWVSPKK